MAFWKFVLQANIAFEFTRCPEGNSVASSNSQSTTQQFFARVLQILVNAHNRQSHRVWNCLENFRLVEFQYLVEFVIWLFCPRHKHFHIFSWVTFEPPDSIALNYTNQGLCPRARANEKSFDMR